LSKDIHQFVHQRPLSKSFLNRKRDTVGTQRRALALALAK
jgi:hypothetical protein